MAYHQEKDGPIKPQQVVKRLYELTKGRDPIVSTDVGQHQMWAAQYFKMAKPNRWLTSGGLGTMGFGFPAAMGAQAAFRDRLVLCIAGDGSIQMNMQEMATAVVSKLPVKVIILNNRFHGMVRQWQDLFYEGTLCVQLSGYDAGFREIGGSVWRSRTPPEQGGEISTAC